MTYKTSSSSNTILSIGITCSHCGCFRAFDVPFFTPWRLIAEQIEQLGWRVIYHSPINITLACNFCQRDDESLRPPAPQHEPDLFDDPLPF